MMSPQINEFKTEGHGVVIGAGIMGAGIAAILANAGWRVTLLDRVPEGADADAPSRNRLAKEGLERAKAARPAHFGLPEYATKVRLGNIEDNAHWLAEADWIVEAAAEDPVVKMQLMALISKYASSTAVISSNTSGLSLASMISECPEDLRRRFLGTHFFNPPRWMRPLELVPTESTDPEIFSKHNYLVAPVFSYNSRNSFRSNL